jgi:Mg/Co/Ni transporter MgtE
MTPEQVNEAWQRVQGLMQTIEQRNTALDVREAEIRELGEDISKRWKDIGVERQRVEQMQRELTAKIAKFEQTVKLVSNDEVPKLKANAATLASFERKKASELVQQQWDLQSGQDEILRVLEFMDKDAVNEILAELPNNVVQEILEKRMQISKEPKPSGG